MPKPVFRSSVVVLGLSCATAIGCASSEKPDEGALTEPAATTPDDARAKAPAGEPPSDAAAPEPAVIMAGGDFGAYAKAVAAQLSTYYRPNGLFATTSWWNSANALTALIDYGDRTGDGTYVGNIATTFDAQSSKSFLNDYYDDEGWWALAWIRAYDVTKEARYLAMAKTIFADMTTGWDAKCGGGIWWRKDRAYKNAIANELFLEIAARLHERTPGDTGPSSYLSWAERTWAWFQASGMINASSLVNDGLETSTCKTNNGTTWTYNQGVIVGALVVLARIKNDRSMLQRAQAIADASMRHLVDDVGVLREPCGSTCDADQSQFKGIFMRHLFELAEATKSPTYRAFLASNADWIWNAATDAGGRVGLDWSAPFDKGNASMQSSALDALNAAIALSAPQNDLAAGRPVTANASCAPSEGPENAVDADGKTKWCAGATGGGYWIEIDLGADVKVGRVVVRHAGSGGEDQSWNTRGFSIRLADASGTFTEVAKESQNSRPVTIHRIEPRVASKLRIEITKPQIGEGALAARLYGVEAYAR